MIRPILPQLPPSSTGAIVKSVGGKIQRYKGGALIKASDAASKGLKSKFSFAGMNFGILSVNFNVSFNFIRNQFITYGSKSYYQGFIGAATFTLAEYVINFISTNPNTCSFIRDNFKINFGAGDQYNLKFDLFNKLLKDLKDDVTYIDFEELINVYSNKSVYSERTLHNNLVKLFNPYGGIRMSNQSYESSLESGDKQVKSIRRQRGRRPKSTHNRASRYTGSSTSQLDKSSSGIRGSFSTGIPSGLLKQSSSNGNVTYSPMFMQFGVFSPIGIDYTFSTSPDSETEVMKQVRRVIIPRYMETIKRKINYSFSINENSSSELMNYFQVISEALQIYFSVESVISYYDNYSSRNSGFDSLMTFITPDIIRDHQILRKRLEFLAIPPNILKTIHFLYQPYSYLDDPGSAILKLNYGKLFWNENTSEYGYNGPDLDRHSLSPYLYTRIFNELETFSTISATYYTAYPEHQIKLLPLCSNTHIYDKQFINFWMNSSVNAEYTPDVIIKEYKLDVESSQYPIYTVGNHIDGLILSLCSVNNNSSRTPFTGLWQPMRSIEEDAPSATSLRNRISRAIFISDTWVGPQDYDNIRGSAWGHWLALNSSADEYGEVSLFQSSTPTGATYVNVNMNQVKQALDYSIDWLYSM